MQNNLFWSCCKGVLVLRLWRVAFEGWGSRHGSLGFIAELDYRVISGHGSALARRLSLFQTLDANLSAINKSCFERVLVVARTAFLLVGDMLPQQSISMIIAAEYCSYITACMHQGHFFMMMGHECNVHCP